jgi:predicted transcriptional regulator
LPDDHIVSSHISLRVPKDVIEAFDRLAALLDRPRSCVMLRTLRQYLEDEGAELAEDAESLAELDRGETVSDKELRQRMEKIIAGAQKGRIQQK